MEVSQGFEDKYLKETTKCEYLHNWNTNKENEHSCMLKVSDFWNGTTLLKGNTVGLKNERTQAVSEKQPIL